MSGFDNTEYTMDETNIVFMKDDVTINGQSAVCLEDIGIRPCGDHVAVTLTIVGNLKIEGLPNHANIIDPEEIYAALTEEE